MELLTIITMLALLQYIWMGVRVGAARGKYGVKAPATAGDEMFDRHYRVHYNTLEQLVVFLPSLWAFAHFVSLYPAVGLGVIYLIGRIVYALGYVKDPSGRGVGFMLSALPCYVLLLGSLAGAVWQLITA